MYVEKTHTWDDNWNDIIRKLIFQDAKMKEQMVLPPDTAILKFIEKYFIKDAAADEMIINEQVRIVHCDTQGRGYGNPHVKLKYKAFDIYVKDTALYNATNDRIKSRCNLIAERLKYLLLKNTYTYGLRIAYEDEYEQWTKVVGYKRYRIIFSYNTTV